MESTLTKTSYDASYFYALDYENKFCVDCKKGFPSFFSINNGILICRECASEHRKYFNFNVSYIREIKEQWDQYLISFIQRGGNARFIRLCNEYQIKDFPIQLKYMTKICEYYRLLIKSEILSEEPPNGIYPEYAQQPSESNEIFFSEFENYQIFVGSNYIETTNLKKQFIDSLQRFVKAKEPFVKEFIYAGGKRALGKALSKGKTIITNMKPMMKYVTKKTIEGIGYMCNNILENLSEENCPQNQTTTQVYGEDKIIGNNDMINPNDFFIVPNVSLLPSLNQVIISNTEITVKNEKDKEIEKDNYNNNRFYI